MATFKKINFGDGLTVTDLGGGEITVAGLGVTGPTGPAGATGPAGPGVAAGGSTGQVLTKTSGTDYATNWQTPTVYTPPALVSSLPGSPTDGQEIYFLADATNGVIWHLRYRAGSASTYKWELVGGAPLHADVETQEQLGTLNTWLPLTTPGPSVTLPLAGDYLVTVGNRCFSLANGAAAQMSYDIGATPANSADGTDYHSGLSYNSTSGASVAGNQARPKRKNGLSATTLTAKYFAATASAYFKSRWLTAMPIRVG